jgi:hypothetical protein
MTDMLESWLWLLWLRDLEEDLYLFWTSCIKWERRVCCKSYCGNSVWFYMERLIQ